MTGIVLAALITAAVSFGCTTNTARDPDAIGSPPRWGYVLNGMLHGCRPDGEPPIDAAGKRGIVRDPAEGGVSYSIPAHQFFRSADPEFIVEIWDGPERRTTLHGVNIAEWVGLSHVLLYTDDGLEILAPNGARYAAERGHMVSIDGVVASLNSDDRSLTVYRSLQDYEDGVDRQDFFVAIGDNEEFTKIAWVDEQHLAVGFQDISDRTGRVVLLRAPAFLEAARFPNTYIRGAMASGYLLLVGGSRKGSVTQVFLDGNDQVTTEFLMQRNDSINSTSPDGRYLHVSRRHWWPPSGWPEHSIRHIDSPRDELVRIGPNDEFGGWRLCPCETAAAYGAAHVGHP